MKLDNNNQVWFLYSDLYQLSDDSWKAYPLQPDYIPYYSSTLFVDKYNNKWMNSKKISQDGFADYGKGGLAKFNNNKWEIISLANSKFKGFSSDELFRDSKNNMWIYSGILTKVIGDSWTNYSPQNTLLPERSVTCINEDADGNLWFGAYHNGLIKYDGINWEIFNEDNSDIPSEIIWDIDFDKEGNLWFVSDYRLVLLNLMETILRFMILQIPDYQKMM
jgi:ligand-binding sensor domain-containing protein